MNTQKQSPRIAISEAFEQFITWLRFRSVRTATVAAHSQKLNQFFKQMQVEHLDQITAVLVGKWLAEMRSQTVLYEEHPYRDPVVKKLSPVTIRERLKTIRYFIKVCLKLGLLDADPLASLPAPKFEKMRVKERTMRKQTVTSLLQVASHPRDLALIAFMADTGVRVGEVPGLLVSQLDLENKTAVIDGKTRVRQVTFSASCAELLRCWLAQHIVPEKKRTHVFVGIGNRSRGKPLTENAIRTLFRKLGKESGSTGPVNPHAMRHMVGQLWTDLANPRLAQEKLGHADLKTTLSFYYHPDFSEVIEKTEKLSLLGS
jgi:site-specific recombinase XerD